MISGHQLDDLQELAGTVLRDFDGAAHVTIDLQQRGEWIGTVSTDPVGKTLSAIEQSLGGPAVEALRSRRIAHIRQTNRETTWREYSEACHRNGIRSVIACPIRLPSELAGVVTVASVYSFGFAAAELRTVTGAASQAAQILIEHGVANVGELPYERELAPEGRIA